MTTKCAFFIPMKHRTCNLPPLAGSRFCTIHEPGEDKIPCPRDPGHLVSKADLERHLRKCKGTGISRASSLPYFCSGINLRRGDFGPAAEKVCALSRDPERCVSVIQRLRDIASRIAADGEPRASIFGHAGVAAANVELFSSAGSPKHMPQIESIVANMEREGMLSGVPGSVFAEFGAGRAQLARFVAAAMPRSSEKIPFVLIDRGHFSHKAESSSAKSGDGPTWVRAQIDIADLDLAALPPVSGARSLVAFGKHLCGAGADLTLNSIAGAREKLPVLGCSVAIALCCYHRSSWDSYCGAPFLEELGFGREDFDILRTLTSWSTSESSEERRDGKVIEDDSPLHRFTGPQRFDIGKASKTLLTIGRLRFLRSKGFQASTVIYVDESISPENVLLLATAPPLSRVGSTAPL